LFLFTYLIIIKLFKKNTQQSCKFNFGALYYSDARFLSKMYTRLYHRSFMLYVFPSKQWKCIVYIYGFICI